MSAFDCQSRDPSPGSRSRSMSRSRSRRRSDGPQGDGEPDSPPKAATSTGQTEPLPEHQIGGQATGDESGCADQTRGSMGSHPDYSRLLQEEFARTAQSHFTLNGEKFPSTNNYEPDIVVIGKERPQCEIEKITSLKMAELVRKTAMLSENQAEDVASTLNILPDTLVNLESPLCHLDGQGTITENDGQESNERSECETTASFANEESFREPTVQYSCCAVEDVDTSSDSNSDTEADLESPQCYLQEQETILQNDRDELSERPDSDTMGSFASAESFREPTVQLSCSTEEDVDTISESFSDTEANLESPLCHLDGQGTITENDGQESNKRSECETIASLANEESFREPTVQYSCCAVEDVDTSSDSNSDTEADLESPQCYLQEQETILQNDRDELSERPASDTLGSFASAESFREPTVQLSCSTEENVDTISESFSDTEANLESPLCYLQDQETIAQNDEDELSERPGSDTIGSFTNAETLREPTDRLPGSTVEDVGTTSDSVPDTEADLESPLCHQQEQETITKDHWAASTERSENETTGSFPSAESLKEPPVQWACGTAEDVDTTSDSVSDTEADVTACHPGKHGTIAQKSEQESTERPGSFTNRESSRESTEKLSCSLVENIDTTIDSSPGLLSDPESSVPHPGKQEVIAQNDGQESIERPGGKTNGFFANAESLREPTNKLSCSSVEDTESTSDSSPDLLCDPDSSVCPLDEQITITENDGQESNKRSECETIASLANEESLREPTIQLSCSAVEDVDTTVDSVSDMEAHLESPQCNLQEQEKIAQNCKHELSERPGSDTIRSFANAESLREPAVQLSCSEEEHVDTTSDSVSVMKANLVSPLCHLQEQEIIAQNDEDELSERPGSDTIASFASAESFREPTVPLSFSTEEDVDTNSKSFSDTEANLESSLSPLGKQEAIAENDTHELSKRPESETTEYFANAELLREPTGSTADDVGTSSDSDSDTEADLESPLCHQQEQETITKDHWEASTERSENETIGSFPSAESLKEPTVQWACGTAEDVDTTSDSVSDTEADVAACHPGKHGTITQKSEQESTERPGAFANRESSRESTEKLSCSPVENIGTTIDSSPGLLSDAESSLCHPGKQEAITQNGGQESTEKPGGKANGLFVNAESLTEPTNKLSCSSVEDTESTPDSSPDLLCDPDSSVCPLDEQTTVAENDGRESNERPECETIGSLANEESLREPTIQLSCSAVEGVDTTVDSVSDMEAHLESPQCNLQEQEKIAQNCKHELSERPGSDTIGSFANAESLREPAVQLSCSEEEHVDTTSDSVSVMEANLVSPLCHLQEQETIAQNDEDELSERPGSDTLASFASTESFREPTVPLSFSTEEDIDTNSKSFSDTEANLESSLSPLGKQEAIAENDTHELSKRPEGETIEYFANAELLREPTGSTADDVGTTSDSDSDTKADLESPLCHQQEQETITKDHWEASTERSENETIGSFPSAESLKEPTDQWACGTAEDVDTTSDSVSDTEADVAACHPGKHETIAQKSEQESTERPGSFTNRESSIESTEKLSCSPMENIGTTIDSSPDLLSYPESSMSHPGKQETIAQNDEQESTERPESETARSFVNTDMLKEPIDQLSCSPVEDPGLLSDAESSLCRPGKQEAITQNGGQESTEKPGGKANGLFVNDESLREPTNKLSCSSVEATEATSDSSPDLLCDPDSSVCPLEEQVTIAQNDEQESTERPESETARSFVNTDMLKEPTDQLSCSPVEDPGLLSDAESSLCHPGKQEAITQNGGQESTEKPGGKANGLFVNDESLREPTNKLSCSSVEATEATLDSSPDLLRDPDSSVCPLEEQVTIAENDGRESNERPECETIGSLANEESLREPTIQLSCSAVEDVDTCSDLPCSDFPNLESALCYSKDHDTVLENGGKSSEIRDNRDEPQSDSIKGLKYAELGENPRILLSRCSQEVVDWVSGSTYEMEHCEEQESNREDSTRIRDIREKLQEGYSSGGQCKVTEMWTNGNLKSESEVEIKMVNSVGERRQIVDTGPIESVDLLTSISGENVEVLESPSIDSLMSSSQGDAVEYGTQCMPVLEIHHMAGVFTSNSAISSVTNIKNVNGNEDLPRSEAVTGFKDVTKSNVEQYDSIYLPMDDVGSFSLVNDETPGCTERQENVTYETGGMYDVRVPVEDSTVSRVDADVVSKVVESGIRMDDVTTLDEKHCGHDSIWDVTQEKYSSSEDDNLFVTPCNETEEQGSPENSIITINKVHVSQTTVEASEEHTRNIVSQGKFVAQINKVDDDVEPGTAITILNETDMKETFTSKNPEDTLQSDSESEETILEALRLADATPSFLSSTSFESQTSIHVDTEILNSSRFNFQDDITRFETYEAEGDMGRMNFIHSLEKYVMVQQIPTSISQNKVKNKGLANIVLEETDRAEEPANQKCEHEKNVVVAGMKQNLHIQSPVDEMTLERRQIEQSEMQYGERAEKDEGSEENSIEEDAELGVSERHAEFDTGYIKDTRQEVDSSEHPLQSETFIDNSATEETKIPCPQMELMEFAGLETAPRIEGEDSSSIPLDTAFSLPEKTSVSLIGDTKCTQRESYKPPSTEESSQPNKIYDPETEKSQISSTSEILHPENPSVTESELLCDDTEIESYKPPSTEESSQSKNVNDHENENTETSLTSEIFHPEQPCVNESVFSSADTECTLCENYDPPLTEESSLLHSASGPENENNTATTLKEQEQMNGKKEVEKEEEKGNWDKKKEIEELNVHMSDECLGLQVAVPRVAGREFTVMDSDTRAAFRSTESAGNPSSNMYLFSESSLFSDENTTIVCNKKENSTGEKGDDEKETEIYQKQQIGEKGARINEEESDGKIRGDKIPCGEQAEEEKGGQKDALELRLSATHSEAPVSAAEVPVCVENEKNDESKSNEIREISSVSLGITGFHTAPSFSKNVNQSGPEYTSPAETNCQGENSLDEAYLNQDCTRLFCNQTRQTDSSEVDIDLKKVIQRATVSVPVEEIKGKRYRLGCQIEKCLREEDAESEEAISITNYEESISSIGSTGLRADANVETENQSKSASKIAAEMEIKIESEMEAKMAAKMAVDVEPKVQAVTEANLSDAEESDKNARKAAVAEKGSPHDLYAIDSDASETSPRANRVISLVLSMEKRISRTQHSATQQRNKPSKKLNVESGVFSRKSSSSDWKIVMDGPKVRKEEKMFAEEEEQTMHKGERPVKEESIPFEPGRVKEITERFVSQVWKPSDPQTTPPPVLSTETALSLKEKLQSYKEEMAKAFQKVSSPPLSPIPNRVSVKELKMSLGQTPPSPPQASKIKTPIVEKNVKMIMEELFGSPETCEKSGEPEVASLIVLGVGDIRSRSERYLNSFQRRPSFTPFQRLRPVRSMTPPISAAVEKFEGRLADVPRPVYCRRTSIDGERSARERTPRRFNRMEDIFNEWARKREVNEELEETSEEESAKECPEAETKGVRLAGRFEQLVQSDPRFEIAARRHLGLVCLRLRPPAASASAAAATTDAPTERLLKRINARGRIHCVPASLKGVYVIRFTVTSAQTTAADVTRDWQEIRACADEVLAEMQRAEQPSPRARVPLAETRLRNAAFGSSLLLANSPLSPKIVNGSFAAIFEAGDGVVAGCARLLSQQLRMDAAASAANDSPGVRRRLRGLLLSGRQFSLDACLDLVHGAGVSSSARPRSQPDAAAAAALLPPPPEEDDSPAGRAEADEDTGSSPDDISEGSAKAQEDGAEEKDEKKSKEEEEEEDPKEAARTSCVALQLCHKCGHSLVK